MQQSGWQSRCLGAAAAVLFALVLSGCDRAVLDPAGDVAREQRNLIYISTALMLLIIVPVMVLIVTFAWRYRKGKGGTYDPYFDHSTSLELLIWSAPLMIIIALGALTWSSTHLLDPFRPRDQAARLLNPDAQHPEPLRVQVVAMDWKWLFIYPEHGIATVENGHLERRRADNRACLVDQHPAMVEAARRIDLQGVLQQPLSSLK